MRTPILGILIMLLGGMSFAHGQKQTERFIPVGQSPGLSGKLSYIGKIEKTDPRARSVTVSDSSGSVTVGVPTGTVIWLDRSLLRLTAIPGEFTHLRPGRRIEIKYRDPTRRQTAEWIKIQVTEARESAPPVR